MAKSRKKASERKEGWFRIIVIIVSGIILKVWSILICILGILNWIVTIFSGKRNKQLAEFCEYWNTEFYRFSRYITLVSNERPFPFTPMNKLSKFER